jgi:hypothetical protein
MKYTNADAWEDYQLLGGHEEEDVDSETVSLGESPEGQDWKPDGRDATPEPPAYLDLHFVLRMQRRVRRFIETGDLDWVQETLNQRKI